MGFVSSISEKLLKLFVGGLPKQFSMIEENNILGIYDDFYILTKTENLVGILELDGASYSSLKLSGLEEYYDYRKQALNALTGDIVMRIYTKRRKCNFKRRYNIQNPYAKLVIDRWEDTDIYENRYFLIFENVTNTIKGFFERKKSELTTSIKEQGENITYITKHSALTQTINRVKEALNDFNPRQLNSTEVLRFYAEYINGVYIPFKPKKGFLSDSYIASNVSFHKDYFIQDFNGEQSFGRFIGVKSYETEEVSSIVLSTLLHLDIEFDAIFSIETLGTEKAKSFLKDRIKFTPIATVKAELKKISEDVNSGRSTLQRFAFNILVRAKSKNELDAKSKEILDILINNGYSSTIETIGMLATYFSMFPNRVNLNHRMRMQVSKAIASLILFEQDNKGFKTNSWGNIPLTMLKNQNQSPFLFNFHNQEVKWEGVAKHSIERVNGHTMIIGGTGAGKTTLMSFLMTSMLKYDIDILVFDRLNGMYSFTEFFDGTYNSGDDFKINPFSLEPTPENIQFLCSFFNSMLGINEHDPSEQSVKSQNTIAKAIDSLYRSLTPQNIQFGLSDFKDALEKLGDLSIPLQIDKYLKNPLFASLEDGMNFESQINTINMDFIVNSQKDAGLLAYYIFHKMINRALNKDRGFFIFIDEFKSYTENEVMNEKINLAITQARKANGVIALAFQDFNQLTGVKNAKSFIANMGNLIIFPQKGVDSQYISQEFGISISDVEREFLEETPKTSRKVLIKNMESGSSNIVDVNLAKLGDFLKIFSSNASTVNYIKGLKASYPQTWRERFLHG